MKNKKVLAVLVAVSMAASLSACGGGSGDSAASSANTEEATTQAEAEDTTSDASKEGESEAITGAIAQFADGWGDTNSPFDPLAITETWTFEEMRNNLGAIPASDASFSIAGNIRTEDNVYWTALRDGYKDMIAFENANGLSGVTIDVQSALNEADTEGQLAVMKDQIRSGANVIMISPISTSNCTEGVEVAHEDGIPTIAVNNEFNGADMFVGPNSYAEGEQAAEWANDNVGSGKAAIIMGLAGTDVVKNRTNGFVEKLAALNSEIEVVDQQNADWDRDKAKDVCATFLKTYDDLKIIFCNNDVMALGAVEAIKEANLKLNEDIYVIGADGTDEAYESIHNNELSATISMFPYYEGMMASEVTTRVMLGQTMPKVVWTPSMAVDAKNIDTDDAELIGWTDPTIE
ncbi:MAG: substrate-binding domain-containing protein [Lachnospiraceae bacterium]|jgi:ribose transport system substrate-binding protein|nr:substrate-binding domain-containing protein [Lachnospiraceae bacterium]